MNAEWDSPDALRLNEWEAKEVILRPRRVAAAKQWQPLLQVMHDSGVAAMVEDITATPMPRLEIINRAYKYGIVGEIVAEVVPREENVNVFNSVSPIHLSVMSTEWRISIALYPQVDDQFDSTLRLEATRVPQWTSPARHEYIGHPNTVSFEIDQDRNLRIIGKQEYFNGHIDHLNKRGQNRVRAALNRAFRHPTVSTEPIAFVTLGVA